MLISQIIFKYTQFKLTCFPSDTSFQRKSSCNYIYTLTHCIQKASESRLGYKGASIPQLTKENNKYMFTTHHSPPLNFLECYHHPSGEIRKEKSTSHMRHDSIMCSLAFQKSARPRDVKRITFSALGQAIDL